MMNTLRTFFFLTVLTLGLVAVGGIIGGQGGALIALILAGVMNLGSYWFSDKIVIAMYRGEQVSSGPLFEVVSELCQRNQLPMPRVYMLPQATPNAFATGRNPQHAVVAATEGILQILSREELAGVMAHEMSHVMHRDILIGSIAATIAGAISYLAHMAQWAAIFGGGRHDDDDSPSPIAMMLMAIVAPLAALLVQMAVSRAREFQADASGARLAGRTWGLSKALEKLEMGSRAVPMDANPATAHLFIVNPLSGQTLMKLFSTHPPMEERIARLRAMRLGG
jgi:heat shock protein HtpX